MLGACRELAQALASSRQALGKHPLWPSGMPRMLSCPRLRMSTLEMVTGSYFIVHTTHVWVVGELCGLWGRSGRIGDVHVRLCEYSCTVHVHVQPMFICSCMVEECRPGCLLCTVQLTAFFCVFTTSHDDSFVQCTMYSAHCATLLPYSHLASRKACVD